MSPAPPLSPGLSAHRFRAVPVELPGGAVRLAVALERSEAAGPAPFRLVSLGETGDASVFLGCLLDAAGAAVEWLELWVQNPGAPAPGHPGAGPRGGNAWLDAEWAARAQAFARCFPRQVVWTGYETRPPPPCLVDPHQGTAGPPRDEVTGRDWELCRDDAALEAAGLPTYSGSPHRYLWPGPPAAGGGAPAFLAATQEAPAPAPAPTADGPPGGVVRFVRLAAAGGERLPFNPGGGRLFARRFHPLGYEGFVDLLGGRGPDDLAGRGEGGSGGLAEQLAAAVRAGGPAESTLFTAARGRAERLVEQFHLKTALLGGCLREVRAYVRERQLPLLNLSPGSFRVESREPPFGLPTLWSARPVLRRPGQARALELEASGERYFVPGTDGPGADGTSLYRPAQPFQLRRSQAQLRLRQASDAGDGRTEADATLTTEEPLAALAAPGDLLWCRPRLPSGTRVDLYGHLSPAEGLAPGECRVRILPQTFPPAVQAELRRAGGMSFAEVPFELIPVLSTPCDLYALGVLAVRTLLVHPGHSLASALDELLSLGRQLAQGGAPDPSGQPPGLAGQIAALAAADPRWPELLGPQHAGYEVPGTAEEVFTVLPASLWWETLAATLRLFPGLVPESVCRDWADAPTGALHAAFDVPVADWERLVLRSRQLIVSDRRTSERVRRVTSQILAVT